MQQSVRSWMFNAIQFNDKIQLEITLVGDAQNFFSSIIAALDDAGNAGLGKNNIQYKVSDIFPTYQQKLSELPEEQATKALLRFQTPVTLRSQGKFMRQWDTHLFFTTLLRRITNLSAIHNMPGFNCDVKKIIEQTARIKATAFLVPIARERISTHQNRTINYSGLIGDVLLEGITPELVQILQAGEQLSVGKNTVFGYGRYSISWQK
ncbi:CRISPR system precrRNA processing endoribonuclease RAMP protein Cas6 [Fibrobacter intestinalis]|nr:CRISPR system precrRNA processing endoribonuclease RAMP protein Cas6 [Fibrobacter intestinalis]